MKCYSAHAVLIVDIAEYLRLGSSTKISSNRCRESHHENKSKETLGQVTRYVMKCAYIQICLRAPRPCLLVYHAEFVTDV